MEVEKLLGQLDPAQASFSLLFGALLFQPSG